MTIAYYELIMSIDALSNVCNEILSRYKIIWIKLSVIIGSPSLSVYLDNLVPITDKN